MSCCRGCVSRKHGPVRLSICLPMDPSCSHRESWRLLAVVVVWGRNAALRHASIWSPAVRQPLDGQSILCKQPQPEDLAHHGTVLLPQRLLQHGDKLALVQGAP